MQEGAHEMSVNRIVENRLKGCFVGERRNCYLINKKLQLSSALITAGAVLAASVFFGLLLTGTYYYFSQAAELLMAEAGVGMVGPTSPSQASQLALASAKAHSIAISDARITLLRAVAAGLVLSFGAGYLEIRRTHRIAGPAHKICKYLQLASKGNYTVRIEVRKNDHLRDIAESFNQLMAQLEEEKKTDMQPQIQK